MAAAVLLAGCASDDLAVTDAGTSGGADAKAYVALTFVPSSGSGTRAGSSEDDTEAGRQAGEDYENAITSAVAFFYQADGGVNAAAETAITAAVRFDNITKDNTGTGVYATETKEVGMPAGTYHVIVVANPGTDWWTAQSTLTLGGVRDHIYETAWTESGGSYSSFLMSSACDTTVDLQSSSSYGSPAVVNATVERVAARLDYKACGSFTCTDNQGYNSGATVEITGAALVNNLTAGSYLLKRVACASDTNNVTYLGEEVPGGNYVLDPWTLRKGDTGSTDNIYGVSYTGGSGDPNWWDGYVKEGDAMSDGFKRIGYTLENTTLAENTSKAYNTGVVFKAKFTPACGTVRGTYTDGATFFAWGNSLYASMEDVMSTFYGSAFAEFDNGICSCSSWCDVNTFITTVLKENDPSGYYDYLSKQYEANNSKNNFSAVKDSLYWKAYMTNVCGYSYESGTVTLDQAEGTSTREALKQYGVSTYEDATCYYTWWVRHSGSDQSSDKGSQTDGAADGDGIGDGGNSVMEYAVVRNNIYQLEVESVYGLGGDVPGDNPLSVNVYVNDWLLLPAEELPM